MIYTHGNPIYREVGSCSIYGQCRTELKVLSFYLILDRRGILARAQMYLYILLQGRNLLVLVYICVKIESYFSKL